jgi:hypothetical protein
MMRRSPGCELDGEDQEDHSLFLFLSETLSVLVLNATSQVHAETGGQRPFVPLIVPSPACT